MVALETLTILLLSTVCVYLLLVLVKFIHKVWWVPQRIQIALNSQGIKGPSYKFFHGSSKEISRMKEKALATRPMDLSHHVLRRIFPHIYSWINIYGMNFLQWNGTQGELVVSDPELIQEILINKDNFLTNPDMSDLLKKLLGDGIAASEGERWMKLRKLGTQAFYAENLKGMIPSMIKSAEMMIERWKCQEPKEIEVYEEFRVLTSEVISRTAFGSSYLEGKKIFHMMGKLIEIISRNAYTTRIPGISQIFRSADDIESDKLEKGIRDSVIELIHKREKEMCRDVESTGTDFLGLLVEAHHDVDEGYKISVDDMVGGCKTFYGGGFGTTSIFLTWTSLLLAIHMDWQEKARQEVFKLFGNQHPNSEGIARLKTLSMILHESTRLYPPTISVTRKVNTPAARLGKLILPANINIMVPILAVHHDPKLWGDDVHLFKPERFSEGIAKATNNNQAAFLPFGLGPRSCVGINFVTIEAKIVLSMILQRYRLTLSPNYIHSPIPTLSIRPQHGVPVIFHPLQV